MKFEKYFCVSLFWVFLYTSTSYSFDNKLVHPAINEASSQPEQAHLDEVLKEIGFQDGIDEFFLGENGVDQQVFKWLKQGGDDEDSGLRAFNHFHDPTKPWEDAGLFGVANSSLIWAQQNDASWSVAREHYYLALTTGADEKYAATFATLGQLMHLVSDKAVPAHVRDDAHLEVVFSKVLDITHFEVWTKKNIGTSALTTLLNDKGIGPSQDIFSLAVLNDKAPAPISALWDIDKYDKTNPSVTLEPIIGLAEYTNANFFSEGTPFSAEYPYPAKDIDTEKQTKLIPDPFDLGKEVSREYWMKKATANTDSYRLTGIGYLTFSVESLYIDGFKDFETLPPMDQYVFKGYANLLLPRAVGYSAALLDYFFRGKLEITPPDQYVYSVIDGGEIYSPINGDEEDPNVGHQLIKTLKAKVRNNTPDEEMMAGELVAVAKYKRIIGYRADLESGRPTLQMREETFSYSASEPITISSLSSTDPEEFTFDFTNSPIPAGITDLYLQVVFKGTLGNETEQAIAVGTRDLREPQHITIWNDTDYFQLFGVLMTAEEVREQSPLVAEISYVDPFPFTETIGFSREYPFVDAQTKITIQGLPDARYSRIIVIADAADSSYFLTDNIVAVWPGFDPPGFNKTWKYSIPTIAHQENSEGGWDSSYVYRVRGIVQHYSLYLMNAYPELYYTTDIPESPKNILGPFSVTIH